MAVVAKGAAAEGTAMVAAAVVAAVGATAMVKVAVEMAVVEGAREGEEMAVEGGRAAGLMVAGRKRSSARTEAS